MVMLCHAPVRWGKQTTSTRKTHENCILCIWAAGIHWKRTRKCRNTSDVAPITIDVWLLACQNWVAHTHVGKVTRWSMGVARIQRQTTPCSWHQQALSKGRLKCEVNVACTASTSTCWYARICRHVLGIHRMPATFLYIPWSWWFSFKAASG